MKHEALYQFLDNHLPNNDPMQVAKILAELMQEIEDENMYGYDRDAGQRIDRMEASLLLLAATLHQRGII